MKVGWAVEGLEVVVARVVEAQAFGIGEPEFLTSTSTAVVGHLHQWVYAAAKTVHDAAHSPVPAGFS